MQYICNIVKPKYNQLVLLFASICIFINCKKDATITDKINNAILQQQLSLPVIPFNYTSPSLPNFFYNQFVTIQNNTPAHNAVTNWGATLGRVLFYDKNLSINNTIACASCHQQQFGFTDTAQFSKGFNGGLTKRHSMALANAAYYSNGRFFWDERAATLEEQVLHPIQDRIEMGMNLTQLLQVVQRQQHYPILFAKAFGDSVVTTQRIAKALAQFVRSMVSYTSKYDVGRSMVASRTDSFPNYTAQENEGKQLFMQHKQIACFSCHNTDVFITDNARNNGLSYGNADIGVAIHTLQQLDEGKFKSSSLKNVALRGRFMHDGNINSLMGVIEHYNQGIKMNPNLDVHLMNGNRTAPLTMNLTTAQKQALLAFLHTLTDNKMVVDEKFANPFK